MVNNSNGDVVISNACEAYTGAYFEFDLKMLYKNYVLNADSGDIMICLHDRNSSSGDSSSDESSRILLGTPQKPNFQKHNST